MRTIIVTGVSGVGKSTIANLLTETTPHIKKILTATTREKRSEKDEYFFKTKEEFINDINDDKFIEYEEVYEGVFYGIYRSELIKGNEKGNIPILVLDVKGALKLKSILGKNCLTIFISGDVETIKQRLINRGDTKNIDARVERMKTELALSKSFDYVVPNEDISECYKNIYSIIKEFNSTKCSDTIVCSLYGGPGTGKSTISAGLFYFLKMNNVNCELVTEYAKDLVWEESFKKMENQINIFGKQHHRIFRLLGKVDVIITDSPLLMATTYTQDPFLRAMYHHEYDKFNNYDVFLTRSKKYNPKGRTQTLEQAIEKDEEIKKLLRDTGINYKTCDTNWENIVKIGEDIINLINSK